MQADSYRHILVPTALVRGEFGRQTTLRIAQILVNALPEALDIFVNDATHVGQMSHPERLAAEMHPFSNGITRPLQQAA